MKALDVQNISIEFGGLKALQDVSLWVSPQEVVGLIGPNGAGKTTLFNILTGIYRPSSGHVFINERNHHALASWEITNQCKAARTFQNIRLFKDLSVLDNVLVASHRKVNYNLCSILFRTQKYLKNEQKIREEAFTLLKIFNLNEKADELAKNLPYGEQRKLEIVRALATQPRLLFLDEPAAGMNAEETLQLLDLIRFVRDQFQLALLVIEHDMKFIMGLCERIYVLDHGQCIAEGTPQAIQSNPEVIRAYLGESHE